MEPTSRSLFDQLDILDSEYDYDLELLELEEDWRDEDGVIREVDGLVQ